MGRGKAQKREEAYRAKKEEAAVKLGWVHMKKEKKPPGGKRDKTVELTELAKREGKGDK